MEHDGFTWKEGVVNLNGSLYVVLLVTQASHRTQCILIYSLKPLVFTYLVSKVWKICWCLVNYSFLLMPNCSTTITIMWEWMVHSLPSILYFSFTTTFWEMCTLHLPIIDTSYSVSIVDTSPTISRLIDMLSKLSLVQSILIMIDPLFSMPRMFAPIESSRQIFLTKVWTFKGELSMLFCLQLTIIYYWCSLNSILGSMF